MDGRDTVGVKHYTEVIALIIWCKGQWKSYVRRAGFVCNTHLVCLLQTFIFIVETYFIRAGKCNTIKSVGTDSGQNDTGVKPLISTELLWIYSNISDIRIWL